MRVAAIRGYRVECRLPEAQGNASGYYATRGSLVVEVVADTGHSGWGEAWHSPDAAAAIIRVQLAPVVLGADPGNYGCLWEAMFRTLGYDRRGVGIMAISALDVAMWDLRARALGVPLYRLLGGARRRTVPAYAAGPYFRPGGDPYRAFADEAAAYAADGYRALKMKIGVGPAEDAQAVAAVRGAVGRDVAIMVDANQGYTVSGALELARRIEPYDVTWLEEPVAPDDLAGYRRVAEGCRVPIAGGEALGGLRAFVDFLTVGAPGIVEPDLAVCGGFTEGMRIAAVAEGLGVPLVPHVWGTAVTLYASLQWLAVLPSGRGAGPWALPWLEYDRSPNPLRDLFGTMALDADGTVTIPDGPGLGVEVHREAFAPYVRDSWVVHATA